MVQLNYLTCVIFHFWVKNTHLHFRIHVHAYVAEQFRFSPVASGILVSSKTWPWLILALVKHREKLRNLLKKW